MAPMFPRSDHVWLFTLKNRVYQNNLHTIDELKDNIRTEIQNISEELLRVNANFMNRRQECLQAYGHHFEQFL
jgi:hypothetical protein